MSSPRVGIVGAGPMGRLHARTIAAARARDGDCELVVVVDRHLARAEAVATESGGRASDDLDAVLDEVDAMVVAVPAHAHFEVAAALLDRGIDVLLEKPLAASIDEAERLVDLAAAGQRILQVGHVEWYNPAWRRAAEHAGRPLELVVERFNPPSDRGLDIDVVQDFMLHDLDRVTRLLGEVPTIVEAEGRCVENESYDEASAQLLFPSGCRATLRVSRVHAQRHRTLRIVGCEGTACADLLARRVTEPAALAIEEALEDPLTLQWRDFMDALRTRRPPENDGRVGLEAMRSVERVRDAIATAGRSGRGDDPDLGG